MQPQPSADVAPRPLSGTEPAKPSDPAPTRRRGATLERALLAAAWEQLQAEGYGNFTFEAVAARAGTSKSVIYRRWHTREELIRALVRSLGKRTPRPIPDTGSLRGDLIALLTLASAEHSEMIPMLSVALASHFGGLSLSFNDFREEFIGDRELRAPIVLQRAAERGELDAARITPRLAALPFDLFRNEFLTTLESVPTAVIEEIVDEVVLPLLTATGAAPAGAAPVTTVAPSTSEPPDSDRDSDSDCDSNRDRDPDPDPDPDQET